MSAGWEEHGQCAYVDPELFFPEKGGSTRAAKAICARCPVKEPCLAYSLIAPEWFGVWGGLSQQERRLQYPDAFARDGARRNRGRQGCGTDSGYQRHKSDGEDACEACREAAARARHARDKAREVPA